MSAKVAPRSRPRSIPLPQLVGTDLRLLDSRAGWVAEQKWDGWRALLDAGSGRLFSRQGTDLTAAFPDVLAAASSLGDLVLDGELVCLTQGRPDFSRVSARGVCTGRAAGRRAVSDPAVLVVWDVLRVDDDDLRPLPWTGRRRVLDGLGLPCDPRAGGIVASTVYDDVPALLQATFELGLEGIVAKMPTSPYRSGVRSSDWCKVKHGHHRDVARARRIWPRSA